jgi:hypothetical protein
MRELFGVLVLVALSACAGEKPAPDAAPVDSAAPAPASDSVGSPRPDVKAPPADSVMARDTAQSM